VQLATPGFLQGRLAGLYSYVFLASGPIGSLLAGWLAERGTWLAFFVGGASTIVMVIAGALLRPWPMPTGTVRARSASARRRYEAFKIGTS
jgi:hypothetical protein